MEKANKPANYTPEQAQKLAQRYSELRGDNHDKADNASVLDTLATEFSKPVRSVRMKLVAMKVYKADDKTTAEPKSDGPSKKELVAELEAVTGLDLAGVEGASKAAITDLIEFAKARKTEIADESAVEAVAA
jgi:hypothetical protein